MRASHVDFAEVAAGVLRSATYLRVTVSDTSVDWRAR
jgi:hypothetical protein